MGIEKKVLKQRVIFTIQNGNSSSRFTGREGMGKELLHSAAFGLEPANAQISSNIFWENIK